MALEIGSNSVRTKMRYSSAITAKRRFERGFTLVELMMATVIILVGLVAVAQLVPMSVLLNSNTRNDGTALVFAQRQMEVLRSQPINSATFKDAQGISCPFGQTCLLGDPTQLGVLVGSPVVLDSSGYPLVDFSAAPVDGYSFQYIDPNDPASAAYDVRWAIAASTNQGVVTGKRIVLGVFRRGMNAAYLPVTLDSAVQK